MTTPAAEPRAAVPPPSSRTRRRVLGIGLVGVLVAAVMASAGLAAPQRSDAAPPSRASAATPAAVTGNVFAHDPSMARGPDGTYLLAATAPGIAIRTSTDGKRFTYRGVAFPSGTAWTDRYTRTSGGNLWAPDLTYRDGRFWLYYSASSFGSNNSAIFLSTSKSGLPGTWSKSTRVYSTTTSSNHNAIDPDLYVDSDGRWWLTLGSFWTGIKQIELNPATGTRKGSTLTSLAARPGSTAVEAPAIVKHGSYYYLFTSWDSCCKGTSSTYRIMVGRASKVSGPYYDRDGKALTAGGGTQVLATNGRYIGPGGQSLLTDSDGELLVYHYYDGQDNGVAKLGLGQLGWDASGWPTVG